MILNETPQDAAILSNVQNVGTFSIKTSARAFSILSSGLYANKIRAIIRELSCNARDSHVAAGKTDIQFDVHLPSTLEPWFAVRDFGTGLSDDQVNNIYTTYFSSTKTDSNDYIGALGLGSKSPFSYTDNFTVTAIKDGKKGIYSAFINEHGVPSIALMMTEETTEPAGVEVKFAVPDRNDFYKFRDECQTVFRYFEGMPTFSGVHDFEIDEQEYETKDIVPGVHLKLNRSYYAGETMAIMGNIAYPIDVPNADTVLGTELRNLLHSDLVIHFPIGSIDFQASREGLSYDQTTVKNIKSRLQEIYSSLAGVFDAEVAKIDNEWEKSYYISKSQNTRLWKQFAREYTVNNPSVLCSSSHGGESSDIFGFTDKKLAEFNIKLDVYKTDPYRSSFSKLNSTSMEIDSDYRAHPYHHTVKGVTNIHGHAIYVENRAKFIINDTKKPAIGRIRYNHTATSSVTYYALSAIDKTAAMDTDKFFALIKNPPESQIVKLSSLEEKPKETVQKSDATVLTLSRQYRGYQTKYGWDSGKSLSEFSDSETHYYLPLKGFSVESKSDIFETVDDFYHDIKYLSKWDGSGIHGVRKADIEEVKAKTNWVNIEDHIISLITSYSDEQLASTFTNTVDLFDTKRYHKDSFIKSIDAGSPLRKTLENLAKMDKIEYDERRNVQSLCEAYDGVGLDLAALKSKAQKIEQEIKEVISRYPLLTHLRDTAEDSAVVEYIKLTDRANPIKPKKVSKK